VCVCMYVRVYIVERDRERSCCGQAIPIVWTKCKLQGSAERQGRRQRKTRPRTKWPEEVNKDSRFMAIGHGGGCLWGGGGLQKNCSATDGAQGTAVQESSRQMVVEVVMK